MMRALLSQPSIKRRILITLLATFVFIWAEVVAVTYFRIQQEEVGVDDSNIRGIAEGVRAALDGLTEDAAVAVAAKGAIELLEKLTAAQNIPADYQVLQVWNQQERLVARSAAAPTEHANVQHEGFLDVTLHGVPTRVYSLWTHDHRYRIDTFSSIASRRALGIDYLASAELLVPLGIAFTLVLIVIWIAIFTALKPLHRLSRELAQRAPGDLSPIHSPHVFAEYRPVVAELNSNFQRLKSLLERERNFLADAAHELRTPLALITAQSDTLIKARDLDERLAASQLLAQGIARASRVVHQLLLLARLEAKAEIEPVTTDVANVVRETLAAHYLAAHERAMELSYVGPDHLVLPLAGSALESILDNLVGNAVRYGQHGGAVQVEVTLSAEAALAISVSDDGPGIDPADQAHVFDRFRRGRQVAQAGSGLGLAIVASAARQLGATLEMQPGLMGRGVSFRLYWSQRLDLKPVGSASEEGRWIATASR